jgi:hypothetical protein
MERGRTPVWLILLGLGSLLGLPWAAGADPLVTTLDLSALYQRLQPGMTVDQAAAAAGRSHLGEGVEPVTSWLMWSRAGDSGATTVVRATFRDDRLVRVELEFFGEEYRRRVKGGDVAVEMAARELRRLLRRTSEAQEAAGECDEALEAFHQLLLGAQERLTPEEQQAWAQALERRRTAQRGLERAVR